MTDLSVSQAHSDVEAGRIWHAIHGLRHVLDKDPSNTAVATLSNTLLTNVFTKGSKAYKDGQLGLATWCFSLLAEYGSPREQLQTNRDALISLLLQRAAEAANAGRISEAKRACHLVLTLDPANSQALLVVGQIEAAAGGNGAAAAMSIAWSLLLTPTAEQADRLRDTALQAGIQALADRLIKGRSISRLLGVLDRLCPSSQAATFAHCRSIALQAENWGEVGKSESLRRAASTALHWLGALRQGQHRYREALDAHRQAFDLWNSPTGLECKAQAQQYLAIEELLESLKGFAYAYVHDMNGQAAARTTFNSLSTTMERLLEAPSVDHWTRTQRWTSLLGLRALVSYASVTGRNPVLPLTHNPFDKAAASAVPAQPASRRIFDCCTFFNEAEILEIRLAELYDVVDRFVVVEATHTHSGEPKTLTFSDHHERFRPYMDKICYVVVDDLVGTFSWQREAYQRDAILRGLDGCRDEDMIIVSDVDEILRRDVVERMRTGGVSFDTVFTVELDLFFYRLNYRFSRNWRAAGAAPFRFVQQIGPNAVRYLAKQDIGHLIRDAGWHFSWIGDLDRFTAKLNAYSHREHAQSFGKHDMAGVANFLEGSSAIPQGAPGSQANYEIVSVDRHPRLVRDRYNQFQAMGWIR